MNGTMNRRVLYVALAIALITFAIYLASLRNDFVLFNDDANVFNNIHIRSINLAFFTWALTDTAMSLWQPMIWLSHAVDYAFWGLNPVGYHLTNAVHHAVNTLLVVYLVVRLLGATGPATRISAHALNTEEILIAGAAAGLFFGIHPIHVESVAWVSGRTDVVFMFFFLLSTLAYLNYAGDERYRPLAGLSAAFLFNRTYLVSFGLFALALCSKPAAVVLPGVLMVLDWQPLLRIRSRREWALSLVEKSPFIVLSAAVSLGTLVVQQRLGTMSPFAQVSMADRLLVAAQALIGYIVKMVLPVHLVPYYPYPHVPSPPSFMFLAPALLVVGITAACLLWAKKWPVPLAVWSYYIITLFPVLGLIKVRGVSMADRYTYLPSLGLCLLVGLGAAGLWKATGFLRQHGKASRRFAAAAGCVVILALCLATLKQITVWRNSIVLWTYVIEQGPFRIPLAFNNRGLAFLMEGQYARAIEDCSTAIALDPDYYLAYYNRGKAYAAMGQFALAMEDFDRAVGLNDAYAEAYVARGRASAAMGRYDRAIEDLTTALTVAPDEYEALAVRGLVFKEAGEFSRAIQDYDKALALYPSSVEIYNNRGVAFKNLGRLDMAIADYTKAVSLDPAFYLAYSNRAIALRMLGEGNRAIEDYSRAIALKPDLILAYLDRGALYRQAGEDALAKADFERACSLGSQDGCAMASTQGK